MPGLAGKASVLLLTGSRRVMGDLVNRPVTAVLGWTSVVLIVALNVFVLLSTFGITP